MSVEPGGSTLIVVAIVAAATLAWGWKQPFWPLSVLVLAIPIRDFSTRWLNVHSDLSVSQVTAIGRWWFVLIATLLALVGGRKAYQLWRERRIPRPEIVDAVLGLALGVGVVATFLSSNLPAALTSFRGYIQPLGVFVLARAIVPSRRQIRILLVLWLIVGAVMAGFGLLQATTWSEADYRAEGYVRQDGELVVPYVGIGSKPYLRPASTVSGPNELGVDMVLLFVMALIWLLSLRSPRSVLASGFAAVLFTAGLGVTVSRSALLAFVTAVGGATILYRAGLVRRLRSSEHRSRSRFFLALGAAIAITVALLAGPGLISLAIETIRSLTQQYHYLDSVEAIRYLAAHPQGVGMGLVEPKGALTLLALEGAFHVEGSLFQIAMEMGVWGLAAWLAFWGVALGRMYRNFHALKNVHLRVLAGTAFAGWLGSLVAFLFLPLMQSISLMVWLWFLLGAGYQSREFETAWQAAEPLPSRS